MICRKIRKLYFPSYDVKKLKYKALISSLNKYQLYGDLKDLKIWPFWAKKNNEWHHCDVKMENIQIYLLKM